MSQQSSFRLVRTECRDETGAKIRSALETAGVEFIDEKGGGPGVRLRERQVKKG